MPLSSDAVVNFGRSVVEFTSNGQFWGCDTLHLVSDMINTGDLCWYVFWVIIFIHHHHHHANRTFKCLTAGKFAPFPDCRWVKVQLEEGELIPRLSLVWLITQRIVVIPYRCFGTTVGSILSRNVRTTHCAVNLKSANLRARVAKNNEKLFGIAAAVTFWMKTVIHVLFVWFGD
jgi:hypothetical protein